MNIVILNGDPGDRVDRRDRGDNLISYLHSLSDRLRATGHEVRELQLRELDLRDCVGCFGCWVKRPGACVVDDASHVIDAAVINSDLTIWASPLRMGFPSALLKRALDKSIPLIHPYFDVVQGEAHHRARYARYPRFGLILEPEATTDDLDVDIVSNLLARTALNIKSSLSFATTTEADLDWVVARIESPDTAPLSASPAGPLPGIRVAPISRLTLFNGSPRGRRGNTPILLDRLAQGFRSVPDRSVDLIHLNRTRESGRWLDAVAEAECVWLGFPLYTDAMPGLVKGFIEHLEPLVGRTSNPPIGFLVQSGFPESAHSRYVERYLARLAQRLKAPYLGTIVKGGGEGVRLMPEASNRKLFRGMQTLGRSLAVEGRLDPRALRDVAGVERYPALLAPVFRLFVNSSWATGYWDEQLKRNGVFEQRCDRPFDPLQSS